MRRGDPGEAPAFSVVMPAYNEEAVVERTIRELSAELDALGVEYEIICVNDNSTDGTLLVLERLAGEFPRLHPISNPGPNGYGYAIRRGLEHYRGDAVVIVTADGSDAPADVVAYVTALQEGFECAFGSRFAKGAKVTRYPPFKLVVNRLANTLVRFILRSRYDDYTNGFKGYRRQVIDAMQPIVSGQFNITVELAVKAVLGGYRYKVVPTHWTQRDAGASSFRLFKLIGPYFASLSYCLALNALRRGDRQPRPGPEPRG